MNPRANIDQDRTLQNAEAECSVLGAILSGGNNGALHDDEIDAIFSRVQPSDFLDTGHRTICEHMMAMHAQKIPIDSVSLADRLERTGDLSKVGGEQTLIDLVYLAVPNLSHILHHARLIRDAAVGRAAQYEREEARKAVSAGEDPSAVLTQALARITVKDTQNESFREMFHSWEDFQNSRGLEFAIEGFLQIGAATFIAGLAGHDKTNIALSMVKASLTGNKLWDIFSVGEKATRVLYLIPESSIGPFKHRLELFGLMEFLKPDDERLLVRTLSKGLTPDLSDPRILAAAKGADVYLDTAVRFAADSENEASDVARGLSSDIFKLLGAGARLVNGLQHAPKSFATQNVMTLENILRGSSEYGALLATCWGVRLLDQERNIVYVQNCKPRDLEPCRPFQLIGRPYINTEADFRVHKMPGESGWLQDELDLGNRGGAPKESRDEKSKRIAMISDWLQENPKLTAPEISALFAKAGMIVPPATVRYYWNALP